MTRCRMDKLLLDNGIHLFLQINLQINRLFLQQSKTGES